MALPINRRNQLYTTKKKLVGIFSPTILAPNESKVSDFAGMDGGAFYIGSMNKGILISHLAKQQAEGDYKLGLVPTIDDMTILFGDIDHKPNDFDFALFLQRLAGKFNELATNKVKDAEDKDILITKREDSERYHVYIPCDFGEVSSAERALIYEAINEDYGEAIIDTAANTIRIEGFEKWCKETKAFLPGSRYLPIGAAKELSYPELLEKVWLNPRGWSDQDGSVVDPQLSLAARLALAGVRNDEERAGQIADDEKSQSLSRNDSSLASIAPERESSVNAINNSIKPDIEEKIKTNCPEIAHIALTYPVVSFKKRAGHITMILDKSEKGRTCKIANAVHSRSNIYLYYNQKTKCLYQKCFSNKCAKSKAILLHRVRINRARLTDDRLPTADDASIAEQFVIFQPLTRVEKDAKKTYWYIYDNEVGYWKRRQTEAIMKIIMAPFRIWLKEKFSKAAKESSGDTDDMMAEGGEIDKMLRRTRDLKGVAECIKWLLNSNERIVWNSKADYTVFPNGVLQLDKRDERYPELYYFGPTKPDEYINDAKVMRRPFNCPPMCYDGHYITQARELLDDWILLIQPIAEDRKLLLTFVALSLKAINYKKMILNIGHSGDNAKSSFFEMVVYALGDYGVTGDKSLIVKGKKDRASKACLNEARFVLFEEPDPSKPLDVEFLKDLVGGANTTAGRFNFSNDNEIKLHCKTVLNANTMTSVQLERAIMNRLLFLAWYTIFTNNLNDVNPDKRIYLADEKFKTTQYWDSIYDGFIWLLLNHYRIFENDGFKLAISDRQLRRTKAKLLDNDLFIRWFKENFVFLADTPANEKKFITQEEVLAEFRKLTPTQQHQIIGRRNYQPAKYVKDMIQIHSAFHSCYRAKLTNWRLSLVERKLPGAYNKTGLNKAYVSNALIRFITRAEYENGQFETASLSAGHNQLNDGYIDNNESGVINDESEVVADYLESDELFFNFQRRSFEIADDNEDFGGIQLEPAIRRKLIRIPFNDNVEEIEQQLQAASVDVIDVDDEMVMINMNEANDINNDNNGADDNDGGEANDEAIDVDNDKAGDEAMDIDNDKAGDEAIDIDNDKTGDEAIDIDNDKAGDEAIDIDNDEAGDEAMDVDNSKANDNSMNNDEQAADLLSDDEESIKDQRAKPKPKGRKRTKRTKDVTIVYKKSKYAPAKKKRRRR